MNFNKVMKMKNRIIKQPDLNGDCLTEQKRRETLVTWRRMKKGCVDV